MPRKKAVKVNEKDLTKGQLRKLNALRKSLEDEDIAVDAFTKWLKKVAAETPAAKDRNAELVAEALQNLREQKNLAIPKTGYVVRSGRGRVIVEPANSK